jgi:uncharacterized OB-fold protein
MVRPLPNLDGPDQPFWRALREREVRVQRCGNCLACRFPATRFCSQCRSEISEWHAVAPTGIIETWCVFHRAYFDDLPVPYTVVQVRLECGVQLFSNPVGVEAGALRIGLPVEAVFEDISPEVTLLKFRPRKGEQ